MALPWTSDSGQVTADSATYTADAGAPGSIAGIPFGPLYDLAHWWSNDLSVAPNGDFLLASGTIRSQQRILRRLLTNPNGYIWHPEYGGGLPQFVGLPLDIPKITAVIRAQLALEDTVARSPAPQISVSQLSTDYSSFDVSVTYTEAATQSPVVLSFSVSN